MATGEKANVGVGNSFMADSLFFRFHHTTNIRAANAGTARGL
jgi:hypothetical protein